MAEKFPDDQPKRQSPYDSGERRAVAEEAARLALAMQSEQKRSRDDDRERIQQEEEERRVRRNTPPDARDDWARSVREMVVEQRPAEWFACEKEGPASKLAQRIATLETEITQMRLEKAEEKGAAREIAREAGKAGAMRMAAVSAALSLAVGLGLFALNRMFPTPTAHAQQIASPAP